MEIESRQGINLRIGRKMNTFLMSGLFLLPVFLTVVRHSIASGDWMERRPVTGARMFASSSSLFLPSLRRSTGSSVCRKFSTRNQEDR